MADIEAKGAAWALVANQINKSQIAASSGASTMGTGSTPLLSPEQQISLPVLCRAV